MFKQTATKQQHYEAACALFAARYSIADIARESGIGEQMLRNKLNPDQPHQLTARDLVAIYQVTGDDILFDGLLFDCGLNAVRLPGAAQVAPEARAQQALNASAQILGVTAKPPPFSPVTASPNPTETPSSPASGQASSTWCCWQPKSKTAFTPSMVLRVLPTWPAQPSAHRRPRP